MPRSANNAVPKKNRTEERLRATPFTSVEKMTVEEEAIRLSVWRRFTEAKIISELLTKTDFQHVLEELKAGLCCSIHTDDQEQIYKIFSEGRGLKLELNKKFAESLGEHQIPFFQGALQAGIEGYGSLFFQAKGLISKISLNDFEVPKNKKK